MGFLMNEDRPANQSPNGQAKSDAQEYSAGKANPIRTWQQLGNPLMRIRNKPSQATSVLLIPLAW
jgi:hypothetical protein